MITSKWLIFLGHLGFLGRAGLLEESTIRSNITFFLKRIHVCYSRSYSNLFLIYAVVCDTHKRTYLHMICTKIKHIFDTSKDRLYTKILSQFSILQDKNFLLVLYCLNTQFRLNCTCKLLLVVATCYFSLEINCFLKSCRVINIKMLAELDSFKFQVVFLATIFILSHNTKEPCVRRPKRLQGSFKKHE